ncbi:MAG: hypothetical protein L3K25_18060 [Gammaproteobacteria bacterium]|nr:hypothetical protein [Gammaproteobacteria bacterium]
MASINKDVLAERDMAETDINIPAVGYNWKYIVGLDAGEAGRWVCVFGDGQIIKEDQHEALLENDGFYARLCGKLQH